MGREVAGTGTPHLQGFVSFEGKIRLGKVKEYIGGGAHCEIARDVPRAIQYCKKDGNFVEQGVPPCVKGTRSDLENFKVAVQGGLLDLAEIRKTHSAVYARYPRFCVEFVRDHLPRRVVEPHALRGWQADLGERLRRSPDARTIEFIVDLKGNGGKTWFGHYWCSIHERCQVLTPGKKADMVFALQHDLRVLFVDAPRSKQGEYLQYDFLEEVKNGFVLSSKYESYVKTYGLMHVVVFMNEEPDMTKLSEDRYRLTFI